MPISGLPRPLPECRECKAPMGRQAFVEAGGICSTCATPAQRMARVHTRQRTAAVRESTTRRVNARIDELAARRLARQHDRA